MFCASVVLVLVFREMIGAERAFHGGIRMQFPPCSRCVTPLWLHCSILQRFEQYAHSHATTRKGRSARAAKALHGCARSLRITRSRRIRGRKSASQLYIGNCNFGRGHVPDDLLLQGAQVKGDYIHSRSIDLSLSGVH